MDFALVEAQIRPRCQVVASLWRESLLAFQNHNQPIGRELFVELAEELLTLLLATPFAPQAAQAIGQTVAHSHFAHPDVLLNTQTILGQELIKGVTPEQLAALYPRLLQLQGQFLIGYSELAYGRVLTDHLALNEQLIAVQEQASLLLGKQENAWRTFLQVISDPVILHDGHRILTANPSAYNMLAYNPAALSGKPILSLFAGWSQKTLQQVLQKTTTRPRETAVFPKNGDPIPIQFVNISLFYQQQDAYALIIHLLPDRDWQAADKATALSLTTREVQILQLLAEDKDNQTVAEILQIKPRTVRYHLHNTFKKLRVSSRAAAIHKAWECNLL